MPRSSSTYRFRAASQGFGDTFIRLMSRQGTRVQEFIRYLGEEEFYDLTNAQTQEIAADAQRTLDVGLRTYPEEMEAFFYAPFGHCAEAAQLIIERSGYKLGQDSQA